MDENVKGKIGIVIGKVASDTLGQVVLPIRGGKETYSARYNGQELPVGTRIVVNEFFPPRTVFVSKVTI